MPGRGRRCAQHLGAGRSPVELASVVLRDSGPQPTRDDRPVSLFGTTRLHWPPASQSAYWGSAAFDRALLVGVGVFAVRATSDVRPALVLWKSRSVILRGTHLVATTARRRREEAQHRLAMVGRGLDRLLPAFARHDPAVGVDLDENVVETLFGQPATQSDRRDVVRGGIADENNRATARFPRSSERGRFQP